MKVSNLKHKLEILDLTHKHAMDVLRLQHANERKNLLASCNHKYDDGSTAGEFQGDQRDNWYACNICGETLR